jgi:hypothetical protein
LFLQGIEALETWVEPNPSNDPEETKLASEASSTGNPIQTPPLSIDDHKKEPPAPITKPVVCKNGKCQPYDPTKDRVSDVFWL